MVFFVGYFDDMSPLNPMIRLFVHLLAAILVTFPSCTGSPLFFGLSVLWVAGCTNAYNFIDGMNGLALSMAILAFGALAIAGEVAITIPMIGLCLGVMIWNFPKAYTFIGDGGVYLLGYVVSSLTIWRIGPAISANPILAMTALVLLGGVPVVDTLTAILRRLIARKSPFAPDRGHIHHRLQDKGLSQKKTLFILVCLQAFLLWVGFTLSALPKG